MNKIILVTGNPNKALELGRIFPSNIELETQAIDLVEIQSLDLEEIVSHKLREAYEKVREPVMVEDVSAGLKSLGGLPGPFIKFFMQVMGHDALHKLSDKAGDEATVCCMAGYFDGTNIVMGLGKVFGHTVAMRGDNGFGFDKIFVPENETRTLAEMTAVEKDAISHRGNAFRALLAKLQEKNLV